MKYQRDKYLKDCPFKEEWLNEDDRQEYLKPKTFNIWGQKKYDIDWKALYELKKKTGMTYKQLAESTGTGVSPQWVCSKMNDMEKNVST